MKKTIIVSYSGGLGSFYAAHLCKIKYPETEIKLVFSDTLIEDPDLYRFLRESAKALNLELIEIADGRNPWQVFEDVNLQGNSRIAPCSKILKRETFNKWIKENYPNGDFVVCLGIGWEESERLERAKINNPYEVIAPLCDKPFIFPEDKEKILSSYGIKKPRLYDLGFSHNNCGGFCVRAGLAHFKNLYEKLPEVYLKHEQEQENLVKKNPKLDKPFLKKTINKKTEYLSLKSFREKHLELNEIEKNDFGGCGCFVDDYETDFNLFKLGGKKGKRKPPIRTLILETEKELNKIKEMYPASDLVRCRKWVELRLPEGAMVVINDKGYQRFRVENK